ADAINNLPPGAKVEFFQGLDNEALQAAYSIARVFLFPSLAEGFGWPIVEAQACGCPVLTTGEPPMNEVGGPNAAYIPRLNSGLNADTWAKQGADAIERFLRLDEHELNALRERCINWADRFRPGSAFKGYLQVYQEVMAAQNKADH
ncbi:MAG TPA: glycosyltransferase, partial [Aquabacterium sp.]|nr:glycosyltransferase [Aquabacterium sp.]